MPTRRRRSYPTDLTDAQWAAIAELVPEARPGGRPRATSSRELVNAILYALRGGQAWRLLPHDFPPWQTVYYDLRRWQAEGVRERIPHAVLMADRERAGREAGPSAAIIDSQSVASRSGPETKRGLTWPRPGQEDRGPQAAHPDRHRWPPARRAGPCGRRAGPRRRQTAAAGLPPPLGLRRGRVRRWRLCRRTRRMGEGGDPPRAVRRQAAPRPPALRAAAPPLGLGAAPQAERTFGWPIKNRRLVRDFEQRVDVAETLIRIAATATMLRRII